MEKLREIKSSGQRPELTNKEVIKMEALEGIVDKIGIEEAAEQIGNFFLYREERYKERALEQRQEILLEQEATRYRWKECKNT